MTVLLIITAGLAAIIVAAVISRRRTQAGLSRDGLTGQVLYTDADGAAKAFVSHRHGLVGKPDYIVEEDGALVPIEKKTRDCSNGKPFKGELLQLAAYCLILEDRSGKKVQLGRLQYNDRTIDVPFDSALRDSLMQVLGEIRACGESEDVARSHDSITKCAACEFSTSCTGSLARPRLLPA